MTSTAAPADLAGAGPAARSSTWLVPCAVVAMTAILVAAFWDFSWHRSVGRDTFFTPPHCVLYFGAVLACFTSAFAVLRATTDVAGVSDGVGVFGLRGPLGAFVTGWGGVTMLTAGIFDDWWHGAYGLDILIQSLPHMAIFTGMLGVAGGGLLLAVSRANTVPERAPRARAVIAYMGGVWLTLVLAGFLEQMFVYLMHGARFYCVVALTVPGILSAVSRASRLPYGASATALVYTVCTWLAIAVLPSFSTAPRLGPVFHPVDHFVPPPFPILVLPPALALDWLRPRLAERSLWVRAGLEGSAFLLLFAALQWPFASFLQTPWADNRFFVGNEFAFFQAAGSLPVRRLFYATEASALQFWLGLGLSLVLAVVTTSLGIAAGEWLRKLQR